MRNRTGEGDQISMLSTLARFPCSADKRPMTQHRFKDVGYASDHSNWPLVGVPTAGEFGVLDIDPRVGGARWYDLNFDALPLTRRHETRA
jgi:hypothetical protein